MTLQFSDNTLLPLLLGDHDRHMVRIEQALGVRLSCRGNRVAITGEASRVDAAQAALEGLWRRLERGESVGRPEVEAAIRLADADTDPRLPLSDVPAIRTRRGAVGPRSPGQAAYIEALATHEMVFGVGPAGTGKTYLAVAQAVAMLQAGKVDRIVLSRPAVEAGERLGFLPGDMKEKVDPYLRPLYDALHDMMPAEQVIRRLTNGEIEVAPLAFMRGRTLAHAYAILDEAQNTTAGADEDVADADGRGDAHGGDRRPDAGRPADRACAPACAMRSTRWKASRASAWSGWARATWCGIRWWRASWTRMISAPRRKATNGARPAGAARMRGPANRRWTPRQVAAPRKRGSGTRSASSWRSRLGAAWCRHAESVAARAARAAGAHGTVVLAADRTVQRLNARHRGRNMPTNVLTYTAPAPEMLLALGVIRREAAAAGRRPAHHLAHLVVHGALHLAGHDHHHPGEARRMELAEARILHRLRVPNPWKRA